MLTDAHWQTAATRFEPVLALCPWLLEDGEPAALQDRLRRFVQGGGLKAQPDLRQFASELAFYPDGGEALGQLLDFIRNRRG